MYIFICIYICIVYVYHIYILFSLLFISVFGVVCSSHALRQLLNTPVIRRYIYIYTVLLLSGNIILSNVFHDVTRK